MRRWRLKPNGSAFAIAMTRYGTGSGSDLAPPEGKGSVRVSLESRQILDSLPRSWASRISSRLCRRAIHPCSEPYMLSLSICASLMKISCSNFGIGYLRSGGQGSVTLLAPLKIKK